MSSSCKTAPKYKWIETILCREWANMSVCCIGWSPVRGKVQFMLLLLKDVSSVTKFQASHFPPPPTKLMEVGWMSPMSTWHSALLFNQSLLIGLRWSIDYIVCHSTAELWICILISVAWTPSWYSLSELQSIYNDTFMAKEPIEYHPVK